MPASLKHRWSLRHNPLAGLTTGTWLRLLRDNNFDIDAAYVHRAAFITACSLMNSWFRRKEDRLFHDQIAATEVPPPLFILGHWRTGTTHLHNLLALDSRQFAYANTYQTVNPYTFLTTEAALTPRLRWMLPDRRPMDNMPLSFDAPQEDEFAPCLMTLMSPYLGISFPRREHAYDKFLAFRGVPRAQVEQWMAAFLWFLKKLTFKYRKPLVLKSPPHTARIRLLLEMFPDARFVHIHRHPFAVYRSSMHYFDTATWHTYLQHPDVPGIGARVLARYKALHDAFFDDRPLIPPGQFHELSFASLERDPAGEIERLYHALALPGFATFKPELEAHLATLSSYRKNAFPAPDAATRELLLSECARSFNAWGYSPNDDDIR